MPNADRMHNEPESDHKSVYSKTGERNIIRKYALHFLFVCLSVCEHNIR